MAPRSWLTSSVSVPFAVAGLGYLALVAFITLGAVPWTTASNEAVRGVLSPSTWMQRSTWTSGSVSEFLANIILFIPIGLLMRLALPRLPAAVIVVVAAGITFAIEIAQLPLERVSDPRDLLANGIGALAGVSIGVLALRKKRRDDGGLTPRLPTR